MQPNQNDGPPAHLAALIAGDDDVALSAALAKADPHEVAATLSALPLARANAVLTHVDGKTLEKALMLERKPTPKPEPKGREPGNTPLCVRAMDVAGKLLGVLKVEGSE